MAGGLGQNPGEHMTGVPVARFHGCREMPFQVRNQLPPPGGYELLFDFCKVVEVAVRIRESGRQLIKVQGEIIRCPLVFQTVPLMMLQPVPSPLRVSQLRCRLTERIVQQASDSGVRGSQLTQPLGPSQRPSRSP
ncbi:hypothetical protein ADK96_16620 [Streptomyces sp. IGB124]|nr:hypothetical protein ADK96_16620 [Streptomyces sp. IGB124]